MDKKSYCWRLRLLKEVEEAVSFDEKVTMEEAFERLKAEDFYDVYDEHNCGYKELLGGEADS